MEEEAAPSPLLRLSRCDGWSEDSVVTVSGGDIAMKERDERVGDDVVEELDTPRDGEIGGEKADRRGVPKAA
jgi:hypothetical protein